mmetsp:Transcript_11392/g.15941  ORF Transcript_11392/g.15941 Transcript_11392/m.15941 type:complete len:229 (+) Transcript_11392:763-1449(+)
MDHCVVLILYSTTDLNSTCTGMQKLHSRMSTISTTCCEDCKSRQSFRDRRYSFQSHGSNSVTRHASICRTPFGSYIWPCFRITPQVHQTGNSVDSSHTIGTTYFCPFGNINDVSNVWSKLSKHRYRFHFAISAFPDSGILDPSTDILDHIGILTTSEAHSPFAHTVRTRHVQFNSIRSCLCCALCEHFPVLLVVTSHNRRDEYIVFCFEVSFELTYGLFPVCLGFFRN